MTTLTAVEQQQDVTSLIDLYLLRCQVEGKSPNTITAYGETLTIFQSIAGEEGFPEDVRAIAPSSCCPTPSCRWWWLWGGLGLLLDASLLVAFLLHALGEPDVRWPLHSGSLHDRPEVTGTGELLRTVQV